MSIAQIHWIFHDLEEVVVVVAGVPGTCVSEMTVGTLLDDDLRQANDASTAADDDAAAAVVGVEQTAVVVVAVAAVLKGCVRTVLSLFHLERRHSTNCVSF